MTSTGCGLALSTDLYEITMMAGYELALVPARATFELFVRDLPEHRSYLVAAGLAQALDYLEHLAFTPEHVAFLRQLPNLQRLPASFFDEVLPKFRFTGDVWAVPEGTPVFPLEPIVRVTGPLGEAQLVETALLAMITFQTSIASKAARIVDAAQGRQVMEFGSRRAHGIEAGVLAARAAYVAGCASTSNVEAGHRYGIPLAGTMAHSWVMSFPDELTAFRRFSELFGERAVFLIDTYDTLRAAKLIVDAGLHPGAVRIDSGDIMAVSRAVRGLLDAGGLPDVKILVSGDLDEYRITELLAAGAPVDGFGVGTALSTSKDAPSLGGIYKIVEVEAQGGAMAPVMKLSSGKRSHPGSKQVWRMAAAGHAVRDVVGLASEALAGGSPLLEPVMRRGRRLAPAPTLDATATVCRRRIEELPISVRQLTARTEYPVEMSEALAHLTATTESALAAHL